MVHANGRGFDGRNPKIYWVSSFSSFVHLLCSKWTSSTGYIFALTEHI